MRKIALLRNSVGVFLFFLSSALMASSAFAQGLDPRISLLLGASLPSGSRTFVIGPSVFDTQFQNGAKLGLRGAVNIGEHWGAEATYSFSADGLQITQVVPATVQNFGVHLDEFTGNGLFFFTGRERLLRPFLTAGLGVSHFSPTDNAKLMAAANFLGQRAVITGSSEFDFNFGAGIEAGPWDHFGVRFDLRDHVTGFPRFGLPQSATGPNAPFFPVSGRVQDVELTGGFVYHFVGK
jgi:outer membrane protein with beta-barrel domain